MLRPGSKEAVANGCLCPIIDNNRGEGVMTKDGPSYYMSAACPLHGDKIPKEKPMWEINFDILTKDDVKQYLGKGLTFGDILDFCNRASGQQIAEMRLEEGVALCKFVLEKLPLAIFLFLMDYRGDLSEFDIESLEEDEIEESLKDLLKDLDI